MPTEQADAKLTPKQVCKEALVNPLLSIRTSPIVDDQLARSQGREVQP